MNPIIQMLKELNISDEKINELFIDLLSICISLTVIDYS